MADHLDTPGLYLNGLGWRDDGATESIVVLWVHDPTHLTIDISSTDGQRLDPAACHAIRAMIGLEFLEREETTATESGTRTRFHEPQTQANRHGFQLAFLGMVHPDDLSLDASTFRLLRVAWSGEEYGTFGTQTDGPAGPHPLASLFENKSAVRPGDTEKFTIVNFSVPSGCRMWQTCGVRAGGVEVGERRSIVEFLSFHHPDVSLPVIRRKLGDEMLEAAFYFGKLALAGGRCGAWEQPCYPNRRAYWSAVRRLGQSGLVAGKRRGDNEGVLRLSAEGEAQLSDIHRPERFWGRKWRKTWYVLMYDVPEGNRSYRDHLRRFLKRMRMGGLQKSVWVTPRDIRPEYSDLDEAAGVGEFASLLEARTVLGMGDESIVERAWDFGRLELAQRHFLDIYGENLQRLIAGSFTPDQVGAVFREELGAYRSAMEDDPLLPRVLYPSGYAGEAVRELHFRFVQAAAARL